VTTLREVSTDWRYDSIKRIRRCDVVPRWSSYHYDGPMAGVVEYAGRLHYARCVDMDCHPERRFFVVALSDEEIDWELRKNALWVECYGSHCECNHLGVRAIGTANKEPDRERWGRSEYSNTVRHYSDNRVVGWFEGWSTSQRELDYEREEENP